MKTVWNIQNRVNDKNHVIPCTAKNHRYYNKKAKNCQTAFRHRITKLFPVPNFHFKQFKSLQILPVQIKYDKTIRIFYQIHNRVSIPVFFCKFQSLPKNDDK